MALKKQDVQAMGNRQRLNSVEMALEALRNVIKNNPGQWDTQIILVKALLSDMILAKTYLQKKKTPPTPPPTVFELDLSSL